MALNLADPTGIMEAYDAVLNNELNWILLYHSNRIADELALYAFGSEGLEELKTKIDPADPQQTLIGFLRVDADFVPVTHSSDRLEEGEEEQDGDAKFVMISYVPKAISGVRRARAKVHTRRLGMIFKKHDAVLTVDDLSQLTTTALAHSLAEPGPSLLTFSTSASPITTAAAGAGQQLSSPESPLSPTQVDTTVGTVTHNTSRTASPMDSPTNPNQDQLIRHHQSLPATDMARSYSQPMPTHTGPFAGHTFIDLKPMKRSVSEAIPIPPVRHSSSTGHMKFGSQLSNFLRRKKRSDSAVAAIGFNPTSGGGGIMGDVDESQESADDSMPPPTPPKDKGAYTPAAKKDGESAHQPIPHMDSPADYSDDDFRTQHLQPHPHELEPLTLPPGLTTISETSFRHTHSVSEFAVISHEEHTGGPIPSAGDERDIVIVRPEEFGIYGSRHGKPKPLPPQGQHQATWSIDALKKGKWSVPQGLSAIRDPTERARLRMELQRKKEDEYREALRAEEERQERLKKEKEMFLRMEDEEAENRKAKIKEEALRSTAERRRREERERLEEERRALEKEERRRVERQKRLEEHLRLEEWRKEQQRIADEHARAEEEAKKREEEMRKLKIKKAEGDIKIDAKEGSMTGWVTVQTDESVIWRRRHFRFSSNTFYFYRSPKDLTQVLDRLDVRGVVKALKEPKDGYEDLEAIPYSFAIEFHDRAPWAMFADSEEEKFRLLGLLKYSAGL